MQPLSPDTDMRPLGPCTWPEDVLGEEDASNHNLISGWGQCWDSWQHGWPCKFLFRVVGLRFESCSVSLLVFWEFIEKSLDYIIESWRTKKNASYLCF